MNKWFTFDLWSNPYRTWWKVRKYFKRPKMSLHLFGPKKLGWTIPYTSVRCAGKILTIFCSDVLWVNKDNSPRHERDPYIWVCFFNKFGFSIQFKIKFKDYTGKICDGGMYYWEYLLDYLYYQKDLTKMDVWTRYIQDDEKYTIPTRRFSLTTNGLDKYLEDYRNSLK